MNLRHHHCVAVLFDPDGGEHGCMQLADIYDATGALIPWFWAAGITGPSPEAIADRIHAMWNIETTRDGTYERQERAFTERFES